MTRFGKTFVWIVGMAISAMFVSGFVWAAPPPNDDFSNRTVITSLPFADVLDTSEATAGPEDFFPYGFGQTVWYALTPDTTVNVSANTAGSNYSTFVSVWGDSRFTAGGPGDPVTGALATFVAYAGTTYYFMVSNYGTAAAGVLSFHVDVAQNHPPKQVIGQPDLDGAGCNSFGLGAGSLCNPQELALSSNTLYVVDRSNNRVLAYDSPLTTDGVADHVFGQSGGFETRACNLGGLNGNSICNPNGLAVDASGNLFVADFNNNRVLEYDTPLTTDTTADMVFGQPDFVTATCNTGGLSASSLCGPRGLAVDAAGSLYVSDGFGSNSRILVCENPLVDTVADEVFGQPDFMTAGCNTGGLGAGSVCLPAGTAFDAAGNLYLADQGNGRVLVYLNPLLFDDVADLVIGQPDFTTVQFPPPSASTLSQPYDVALDALGNLYVADVGDNRVLVYRAPLTTDTVADLVYGQPDFTYGGPGSGPGGLSSPRGVVLDANNNLMVADLGNSRVLVYDTDIDFDGLFGSRDACPKTAPAQGLDADHNGCTDTIAGLKTIVQNLSINATLKNGLLAKLNEAQKALNRRSTQVALNKLQDFINQVEAAGPQHISDPDADLLVAYANNLIALLGLQV